MTRGAVQAGDRGFSLVETLVAAGITLALAGAAIEIARGARASAAAIGDMSEAQQRVRVASDAIQHDLMIAGAGSREPLARYLPPIRPSAGLASESDTTFAPDRITVVAVPRTRAEAEVTAPSGTSGLVVGNAPACGVSPACGFESGMQAVVFDRRGPGFGYDVFTVADAAAGWISRTADEGSFSRSYGASADVSEVVQHSYYLDRSNPASVRLMRGSGRSAFPLVDGIDDLRFTYFADPDPMSVSAVGASSGTCVYAAGSPPRPLLAVLGGQSLAELPASALTDGPFCGIAPNRFDADLLRVRRVRVAIRSSSFEVSFDVAPPNLYVSR